MNLHALLGKVTLCAIWAGAERDGLDPVRLGESDWIRRIGLTKDHAELSDRDRGNALRLAAASVMLSLLKVEQARQLEHAEAEALRQEADALRVETERLGRQAKRAAEVAKQAAAEEREAFVKQVAAERVDLWVAAALEEHVKDESKKCAFCKHSNSEDAARCKRCDAPLSDLEKRADEESYEENKRNLDAMKGKAPAIMWPKSSAKPRGAR